MPLAATCQNCQTRYQLPEKYAGRTIKCKKCSQPFAVPAAGAGARKRQTQQRRAAAPQRPKPQRPAVPSAAPAKLRQYGLDGPIQAAGELFNDAPLPNANPLGNHVVGDPGFVMPEMNADDEQAGDQQPASQLDDVTAMLDNPHVRQETAVRGKISTLKPDDYAVARIGLRVVHWGWLAVCLPAVVIIVAALLLGLLAQFDVELSPATGRVVIIGIGIANVLMLLGMLGIFVGHCICIGAPNGNEKLFAALTLGAMLGAFALVVVGAAFLISAEDNFMGMATGIAMMLAGYILPAAAPILFIYYCRSIATNINSGGIKRAAKEALVAQIFFLIAIVVFFAGTFLAGFVAGVTANTTDPGKGPEIVTWLRIVVAALSLLFTAVLVFNIFSYLKMLNVTVQKLAVRR